MKDYKGVERAKLLEGVDNVTQFNLLAQPLAMQNAFLAHRELKNMASQDFEKRSAAIERDTPDLLQGMAKFAAKLGIWAMYIPAHMGVDADMRKELVGIDTSKKPSTPKL